MVAATSAPPLLRPTSGKPSVSPQQTPREAAMHRLLEGLSHSNHQTATMAARDHITWLGNANVSDQAGHWEEALPVLLNGMLRGDQCSEYICKTLMRVALDNESLRPVIEQYAHEFTHCLIANRDLSDDSYVPTPAPPTTETLADVINEFRFTNAPEILYLAGSHAQRKGDLREEARIHLALARDTNAWALTDVTPYNFRDEAPEAQEPKLLTWADKEQSHFLWNETRLVTFNEIGPYLSRRGFHGSSTSRRDAIALQISGPTNVGEAAQSADVSQKSLIKAIKSAGFDVGAADVYTCDRVPDLSFVPINLQEHWSLLIIQRDGAHAVVFDSNLCDAHALAFDTGTPEAAGARNAIPEGSSAGSQPLVPKSPNPKRQAAYGALFDSLIKLGVKQTRLTGGALQQDTPNACGVLMAAAALELSNTSAQTWITALDQYIETLSRRTAQTATHDIQRRRGELLADALDALRGL